ncbi:hypothetical protein ABB37_02478 [Leptomonas pyrrhocoris]|uniref:Uncharacterized protein n=1 Tax=Leptomonas pyrrhocoris TaxID=157538 RepID=A0A0M9G5K9_LEPPY|nr:hypothetical protein ABB37_02478 [Leptomonas pyrrhocoris]KPA82639.1 hypothetical protein ABB37_02478 [Leptomonas pyrrhocoris]|eukprot:XP_015661078.1 hypothetical protein ABB37_02478 [Leptomonas pyrrhocoris]
METNRVSPAKWVSRRTLDSQAHNRDHSAGMQPTRGQTPQGNIDNANTSNNCNMDRRKYGNTDAAASSAANTRCGGGGGNGGSGAYRTSSGNRFGTSNSSSSANGTWSSITSNPASSINKLNHHGMGYAASTLNSHPPHNPGSHHHNGGNGSGNGGRRAYGNGGSGGYGEAAEATMPPPPRSVQMSQGTLVSHSSATARDLIPQPRHARGNSNTAGNAPRPMDNPANSGALDTTTGTRRWASSTSTPTPRSGHGNLAAVAAIAHHDPHANMAALRTSPSSPFTTVSSADARSPPALPLPPPASADVAVLGEGGAVRRPGSNLSANTSSNAMPLPPTVPPSLNSAALATQSYSTGGNIAKPALASPLDALHISEHLIFDTRDFDEPAAIQPSEIEALLGQVERSTAAAAKAPKEASMGGSLRERRSVADWGIEEAIKSVLPGMDEDDNSDDMQGPNVLTGSTAAISGNWHTSGEPDAQQAVGAGLVADFPTSFAASFSEPVSAVLGSPFSGEPAPNTMDNLSRAFSTAVRVDSSSFTTSPATTTAATPLHLPQYTSPDEVITMPPSLREVSAPPSAFSPQLHSSSPAHAPAGAAASLHKEPVAARAETTHDGASATADLLSFFAQAPPAVTSPWLSAGTGEGGAGAAAGVDLTVPKAPSGGGAEKPAETRPSRLQSIMMKNGSIDSSFGLTASISASTPSVPPTRQSTVTTSATNSPSLRKEASTPLSTTRAQAYTSGGARPQRPSLSAPLVNRQTIMQIFRETPQSLQRKERMVYNREHSPQALCKDPHWPPRNNIEAEDMLRARSASKLQRHLTIVCFSRQNVAGVQELFDTWAKNGIPAPDMGFGAYYYYVKEKSEKLLCMKHNGRGPSPGHGYGRCDFESRRPYSTCRYEHVCLFCRSKEHGWFEEGKCDGYQQLLAEMEKLGVVEEDVVVLLNALEKNVKPAPLR